MTSAEKHEYIYELLRIQGEVLATWPDPDTRGDALARMLVANCVARADSPQDLAALISDMNARVARYARYVELPLVAFHDAPID